MNWKNEAMEKLRKYDLMRRAAYNLPRQIRQLEEDAQAVRSAKLTGAKVQGGNRYEDILIDNLVYLQELEKSLEQTQEWLASVEDALDALERDEQTILQYLYINPEAGAVTGLCDALGVEHSTVYRKRDKALQRFTLALYGALES